MTKKWESDKNGNTLVSSYPGKKISQGIIYIHSSPFLVRIKNDF